MQNQAVIIILTLLMNTANALVGFAAFKQGSVGFIICAVLAAAISNTLALFGRPAVGAKSATEEPKMISGASLRVLLPLAFLAMAVSGCANFDWKKFGVDEAMCLSGPVKGALADASNALVDSVEQQIQAGNGFQSAAWETTAKQIGVQYGFAAAACAAEHLIGDMMVAGPAQVCKLNHKQARPEHLPYLRKLQPRR